MAGILGINAAFGNNALQDEQSSQVDLANHTMYNDAVRRQNKEALGQLLMTGGKAGVKTYLAGKQMSQNNANTPVAQDTASSGSDGTVGPSSASSSLSGGQWSQLAGMFMKGLNGMGGGSSGGSAAGGGS